MTLDELQERWNTQDAKLETILHLNVAQLSATHFAAMMPALDRVRRSIAIELVLNVAVVLLTGSFLGDHYADWRYLVPAAVLHLCAILLVGTGVRQLLAARQIDYAEPIVDVQRRLTHLRMSRIRSAKWTLLAAPALWTPLLIVGMKGLLGIDAYMLLNAGWLAVNVVATVALSLALWATARYCGERMSRSPFLQRLSDDLAGRSLNEASAFAERLARFSRE